MTEIYDAPVLVATEELFRFQHEYKPMRWELADMRKIGTILPQEKTRITKATKKRKPTGGVNDSPTGKNQNNKSHQEEKANGWRVPVLTVGG